MRLIAYFAFAFITGLHGFTLFAPYAVFCIIVMHLVRRRRQAKVVPVFIQNNNRSHGFLAVNAS